MFVRDRLAQVVHSFDYEDLSAEAINEAKRLMIDTIGCAFGGYASAPGKIVRKTIRELGGNAEATVIGSGDKTSCSLATLANGTFMRYLDYNDYFMHRDPSHASGNLAAVLAVAEREGLDGRAAILGFVLAYEVQLRFCEFAGSPNLWERGWHHATNMAFSSAALSARLMGLEPGQTANAIAIAGSHNNTLAQSQRGNIPLMKASAEANIAKGGVEAALLAKNGLTGPEEIFEGKLGWIRCVAGEVDVEGLVRPVRKDHFRILDTRMKPYEAEMMTQSPIHAAIAVVRDNNVDVTKIKAIEVRFPHYALNKPSWDPKKLNPKDKETADHSFNFCTSVAMVDLNCRPEQYTEEKLFSPVVRRLMEITTMTIDPELTKLWPYSFGSAVSITLESGETFESVCEYPPGHPDNRMTDEQVEEKFRDLSKALLTKKQQDEILLAIRDIENCKDIRDFMSLLTI